MDTQIAFPVAVDRMAKAEAECVSALFSDVVIALPYYNTVAKKAELAKYSAPNLIESISSDPDSVLVARAGAAIVGFCISKYDDGVIWLAWFGTHKSYRRKGIGAALLQKLDDTIRNGRSHKIWCDCRTENEASKLALSNHGYTQLCTVRNHWYGQDFILWERLVD